MLVPEQWRNAASMTGRQRLRRHLEHHSRTCQFRWVIAASYFANPNSRLSAHPEGAGSRIVGVRQSPARDSRRHPFRRE
jgi:hypothetical protein